MITLKMSHNLEWEQVQVLSVMPHDLYKYASEELHVLHYCESLPKFGVSTAVKQEAKDDDDDGSVADVGFLDDTGITLVEAVHERSLPGRAAV